MLYGHFTTLSTLIDAGIIQPLDPFLSKDRDVKADDFHPAATERFKGKTYGLAWFTQGKEIWCNADLLAKVGAPSPKQLEKEGKWTWETMLDVAKKVARIEGDQVTVFGFSEAFTDFGTFCHNVWAWGADWYDRGLSKPTIDSAQFLNATQFAVDLMARHRVAQVGSGGDFPKGIVGVQVTSGSALRSWQDILQQNPLKIDHALMPKGPTGTRPVAMANNCNYLCKGAKSPDATWLFDKDDLWQGS
jgi:multiple sugar transport system substrate-binding protein